MWLAVVPLAFVMLWVLFLAYSALKAKWSALRLEVKIVGVLVVAVGFLVDVVINWTAGLALGVTRDATLSQKCGRLKHVGGWRSKVAYYLCGVWLDPFEIGGHCRS